MEIDDLNGKLVAVLGYGKEGKATARYLLKHGVQPVLFDQRPWEVWSLEEQDAIKKLKVNFIFGPDAFLELVGFDVVFKSPGIPKSKISNLKSKITSQTQWFFDHCPAKIIGVTGTKGKGTTTTLISEILKLQAQNLKSKFQIWLTGNIGKVQPFEILDDLNEGDQIVYELSSFQLEDLQKSPHVGVVLMVTEDHLDVHSSLAEYHTAKEAITKHQTSEDFAVFNADFPVSVKIGHLGGGVKVAFSRKQALEAGCFVENNEIVFKEAGGQNFKFPITNFQLRGAHNLENICAAVSVSAILGVGAKTIQTVVENFKGLEHRLEFVSEKNGVKYYNDSISTVPDTAIAAINSFTEPEILILGGSSKNSDFAVLGHTIASTKNVKAVVLLGQEAEKIQQAIESAETFTGQILHAKDMPDVFDKVKDISFSGDVVLLSPACASFGMFKNYQDRGEKFREQVEKI